MSSGQSQFPGVKTVFQAMLKNPVKHFETLIIGFLCWTLHAMVIGCDMTPFKGVFFSSKRNLSYRCFHASYEFNVDSTVVFFLSHEPLGVKEMVESRSDLNRNIRFFWAWFSWSPFNDEVTIHNHPQLITNPGEEVFFFKFFSPKFYLSGITY